MFNTVDRNATFKTNSHSAKWAAGLATNGAPKGGFTQAHDRSGDRRAVIHRNLDVVYR